MLRLHNWTYGKSISAERQKLANLNENMKFKGGPTDRHYAKKLNRPMHLIDPKQNLKSRG